MAMWGKNLSNQHQIFAEAIFNARKIECVAEFCFFPRDYEWKAFFKTKFKYLSINELRDIPHDFLQSYDGFVELIEALRESFEREYRLYFNDLWC